MPNTVGPSTKLLPMDDIAAELKIKYGVASSTDNSPDTTQVSGVNSEFIAIAAVDPNTNELVSDRKTVSNSLQLGGKNADQYITKTEAARVEEFSDKVAKVYADEIRSMRDELYQLKGELARQGIVQDFTLYEGFHDLFRTESPKYMIEPICGIAESVSGAASTVIPEAFTEFEIGDWFVIHKDSDEYNSYKESKTLVQVTDRNTVTKQITFSPVVRNLEKSNVKLFKVLGQYNKGSFSFSKVEKNAVTAKEKYTMLNDDSNLTPLVVDQANTGYAVSFKIPNDIAGALTKLSIRAKASGSPGALICHVIKDGAITRFKNAADAASKGDLIASSSLIAANKAATWGLLDFDFLNPSNGNYPIVNGERYCFIIECLNANKNGDHWEIMFSYNQSNVGDNIASYRYKQVLSTDLINQAIYDKNNLAAYDMYYVATTKEIVAEYETPYKEGLYTSKFKLPAPVDVSRVRVVLRINREGKYVVTSSAGAYGDNNIMSIGPDTDAVYRMSNESGIGVGEDVIIGTDIRKMSNVNGTSLTLEKGVYVDGRVPVYRIGYEVLVRAVKTEWDPNTNEFVTSNTQTTPYVIPLKCVMPDGYKNGPNQSDRLVFEAELGRDELGIPLYVNDFQVQIKWTSNFDRSIINGNPELIGRVHDLTVTFDKSL